MRIERGFVIGLLTIALAACATAPKSASGKQDLYSSADATLQVMKQKDPGLSPLLRSAYAYAVFPNIGKGGIVVGAAYGRGVLYEHGRRAGFVELNQGSIGAQLGGQSFAELIVFRSKFDVDKLKSGDFSIGANASAVALTAGASGSVPLDAGVVVFTMPKGGLMAELSVSGQQLNYSPGG